MKNKKKRGFSLVALLASVAILMTLLTTVVVSFVNSSNNAKIIAFGTEITTIQDSVNAYMSKNDGAFPIKNSMLVTLNDVAKQKFEDAGETVLNNTVTLYEIDYDKLNISELKSGNKKEGDSDVYAVSTKTGKVYYAKGLKVSGDVHYTVDQTVQNLLSYNTEKSNQDSSQAIIFEPSEKNWTNQRVVLKVKVPKKYSGVEVKINNSTNASVTTSDAVYNIYDINQDGNYEVSVKYKESATETELKTAKYSVANFDNVPPEITLDTDNQIRIDNSKDNIAGYIKIKSKSDNLSGIKYIKYENEKILANQQSYFSKNGTMAKDDTIAINKGAQHLTVYFEDNAGNSGSIVLTGPDFKTDTSVPVVAINPNQDLTPKMVQSAVISVQDTSAISYSYGWSTSQSVSPTIWLTSISKSQETKAPNIAGTYYLWVKDLRDMEGNKGAVTTVGGITTVNKISGGFVVDRDIPEQPILEGSNPDKILYLTNPKTAVWTLKSTNGNINILPSDISKTGTGVTSGNVAVTDSGTKNVTISIPNVSGTGNLGININGGNVQNSSGTKTQIRLTSAMSIVDTILPNITFTPNGGNGILGDIINCRVNASDASGIASIKYAWSTSDTPPIFDTTAENNANIAYKPIYAGTHYLWVEVIDGNGNVATVRSNAFNFVPPDTTPPVITFTPNGGTYDTGSTASTKVTVTDDSSISSIKYVWTTSTTQPESSTFANSISNGDTVTYRSTSVGNNYLWIQATDAYGNIGIVRSDAFYFRNPDTTLPTIAFAPNGGSSYTGNTITSQITASDAGGISSVKYIWTTSPSQPANIPNSISNGSSVTYTPSSTGTYYLWAEAIDNNENIAVVRSNAFTVVNPDTTRPTIRFSPDGGSSYTGSNISSTVTASDSSGIARMYYVWTTSTSQPPSSQINNSMSNGSTPTHTPPSAGTYYLWVEAVDNNGNIGTDRSNVFTVTNADTTPPTITFSPNGGTYNAGERFTLQITANDANGIASLKYVLTSSASQPSDITGTISNGGSIGVAAADTNRYAWAKATDNNGNVTISRSNAFDVRSISIYVSGVSSSGYYAHADYLPSSYGGVSFPTWTSNNGQDDLIWYPGSVVSTGSGYSNWRAWIPVSNHNYENGTYLTHVYSVSTYLGATSANISGASPPPHTHKGGRNDGIIISTEWWGNCDCGSGHTTAKRAMCCTPGCDVWPKYPNWYICPNHNGSFC